MSAKVGYRAGYRDGQAALMEHLEHALNQLDALERAYEVNMDGRLSGSGLPPPSETPAYKAAREIIAKAAL